MDSHRKTAAERSKSYSLLARFFLEEIDRPLLQELESAAWAARDEGVGDSDEYFALQAAIGTALDTPRKLSELQSDHARLLRDLAPDAACPDHVGVELRMMSTLCLDEMDAWRRSDERKARAVLRQELRVLNEYVMPWLPGLRTRLAELTTDPCCLALAAVAAHTCRNDRDVIDRLLHGENGALPSRPGRGSARATPATSARGERRIAAY